MVTFSQVPASFRTFGIHVEHDNSQAVQAPPGQESVILIVAPQLLSIHSEGEVVPVSSGDFAVASFGIGSMAATMCTAAIRQSPAVPVLCAPLDDETGTQATGDFTFSGTATETREMVLYIAGRRIAVAIVSGDDAAAAETKSLAAVQQTDVAATLPVTAAAGAGTSLDLTARHDGTFGNRIDLRVNHNPGERLPAGLTVVVNAMSGGATDPAISDVLNLLGPTTPYGSIIHPYIDATNLSSLEGDMDARWDAMDTRRGHAFTSSVDTQANLTTLGNSRNSQHNTIFGLNSSPTPAWEIAAQVGAADAIHSDPAQPRRGTILRDVVAPKEADRLTRTQRDILLHDGIATGVTIGGRVQLERLTTTYQVNGSAIPDPSYLDVNVLRISEFIDFQIRALFSSKYRKAKLAKDGSRFGPGQIVLTPTITISEILALSKIWLDLGIVERLPVIADGELIANINALDPNRMDVAFSPDYMNQFRGMAVLNSFLL